LITIEIPEFLPSFTGDDCCGFDRDPFGEQDVVAGLSAAGQNQFIFGHLPQHLTNHNRSVQPVGDFRMTAGQCYIQTFTGGCNLDEDFVDKIWRRLATRQQNRRQKPARFSAGASHVIRIHIDGVPANFFGREGNRIGFGDEIAITHINYGRIFTNFTGHHQPIIGWTIRF
jgi:hypothetical protein